MVRALVVLRGFVALGADTVTGCAQRVAMRLVTVAAHYPGLMHFALHKGSVDVDFIANLSIRVIQGPLRQRQAVCIQQIRAIVVVAQSAPA